MSIDNICMLNVSTEYYVCNQNSQPEKSTEPSNYLFSDILEEKVNEAETQQQTCAAAPYFPPSIHSAPALSPEEEAIAYAARVQAAAENTPPAPEAATPPTPAPETAAPPPPVAETTAPATTAPPATESTEPTSPVAAAPTAGTTGNSYIDQYYPIPEEDVIPKIRELRYIINNEDMAGKTDAEKYEFLEGRFADIFGKDFLMARNLNMPSSMFYMVGIEFNDTLAKYIENPEQANRIRLYGDASTESINNTIREKYPEELTNRDLFLMVSDMRKAGVLDSNTIRSVGVNGANRIMDTLALLKMYSRHNSLENRGGALTSTSLQERDRLWAEKLNDKLKPGDLLILYNVWRGSGLVSMAQDTAQFLVKNMGGTLGADGFFAFDEGKLTEGHSWENMYAVMMAEMAEYDALIRERMKEIDAVEFPGFPATLETPGAEENLPVDETAGAEENLPVEETAGAEENTDTEDNSDSQAEEAA